MKTYLWTGVTAVSVFPYISAYAATTITISCSSSSAASYFATATCVSADKTETFYAYDGGTITCMSGGALIDYTCNVVDSSSASWTSATYYCGSGTFNGGTGCFSCAEYTGVPEATSATRVTGSIASCYVPTGQVLTDDDGSTFDFTSACYYEGTFSPPDTSYRGVSSSSTDNI